MSERLLKTKRQKIAPAKPTEEEPKKVVLVGTYAGSQLTDWPGFYPYPISSDDKVDAESCAKVNEIWLFKGTKEPKYFAAEFVGIKTREELKALGYPAKGKGHGDGTYLLFKIEKTYAPASSSAALAAAVERVIVRTKDFARSPKVRKQLKAYLESTDRTDKELAAQLPSIITKLPAETLRVCETAVQLDFLDELGEFAKPDIPFPPVNNPSFTFIDLFAGIGGFRLAMQLNGGRCVFSSEWNESAKKTYNANYGDIPYGDITKQEIKDLIPEGFDILCAGFPCQPFSIAGVSKKNSLGRATGFEDKTQGTLFFDVCKILKQRRPKAFLLENVKNLCSHDKGNTFRVICEALEELDYSIAYKVIDGQNFVPQHRERILIVGFDRKRYGRNIGFDFAIRPVEPKPVIRDILEKTPDQKYTLSDKLWNYLQRYAEKHKAAGNGFGYGIAPLNGVSRTLSARYYKDGSEILIDQKGKNPRRLTPLECARLMGYPSSFRIVVSDCQAYKQFGNSIVMPLMADVGRLIVEKLRELDRHE